MISAFALGLGFGWVIWGRLRKFIGEHENNAERLQRSISSLKDDLKRAEGEKATSRLHGEGLAEQRLAIAQGLHKSADLFKEVDGIGNADVMNLLFLIQYMDMLGQVGTSEGTHTLMLPHSPSAVGDFSNQIRDAMLVASRASVENAPEAEPTRAPETGS